MNKIIDINEYRKAQFDKEKIADAIDYYSGSSFEKPEYPILILAIFDLMNKIETDCIYGLKDDDISTVALQSISVYIANLLNLDIDKTVETVVDEFYDWFDEQNKKDA